MNLDSEEACVLMVCTGFEATSQLKGAQGHIRVSRVQVCRLCPALVTQNSAFLWGFADLPASVPLS